MVVIATSTAIVVIDLFDKIFRVFVPEVHESRITHYKSSMQ